MIALPLNILLPFLKFTETQIFDVMLRNEIE